MRVVAAAALVAVAASGCAGPADRSGPSTRGPTTSVTADGVYEVGVDVAPGVYTSPNAGCAGHTSYDAGDSTNVSSRAVRVDDQERIVLHRREYFTTGGCGAWHREDPGGPRSSDPATLAGGCEILLEGYRLVPHVVWYLRAPTSTPSAATLQDRLMAPVEAHNKLLAGPARQLVRALDDPSRHVTAHNGLTPDVTRAVAAIHHACATS